MLGKLLRIFPWGGGGKKKSPSVRAIPNRRGYQIVVRGQWVVVRCLTTTPLGHSTVAAA